MADLKISQLTAKGTTIAATDLIEISESDGAGGYVTKSVTGANITSGVSSVTATTPVVATGTTTPVISLASNYGDTQNPYASKTANNILAAPNGTAGVPTFRAIVGADIPTLNQNTTGTAANVTGIVAVANGGTGTATPSLVAGTNVTITGTFPNQTINSSGGGGMAIGGSITSATAGSVLFAGTSGVLQQDNANLFWDDANNRLGIGTSTPNINLEVKTNTNGQAGVRISNLNSGSSAFSTLRVENDAGVAGSFTAYSSTFSAPSLQNLVSFGSSNNIALFTDGTVASGGSGNIKFLVGGYDATQERMRITTTGIGIFTNTIGSRLQVNGNAAIGYSSSTAAPTNGLSVAGTVNIGTNTSVTTAALQVSSTTQGFLPPVMTTIQRNAIVTPAAGLIVYDTTDNKHYGYNGTTWNAFY